MPNSPDHSLATPPLMNTPPRAVYADPNPQNFQMIEHDTNEAMMARTLMMLWVWR